MPDRRPAFTEADARHEFAVRKPGDADVAPAGVRRLNQTRQRRALCDNRLYAALALEDAKPADAGSETAAPRRCTVNPGDPLDPGSDHETANPVGVVETSARRLFKEGVQLIRATQSQPPRPGSGRRPVKGGKPSR